MARPLPWINQSRVLEEFNSIRTVKGNLHRNGSIFAAKALFSFVPRGLKKTLRSAEGLRSGPVFGVGVHSKGEFRAEFKQLSPSCAYKIAPLSCGDNAGPTIEYRPRTGGQKCRKLAARARFYTAIHVIITKN